MFCSNCGNKMADGSKFCQKCGTKVGEVSEEKQTKQEISSDSIPEAAKVYFEQGKKYHENQNLKNAYDAYKSAVQIAPNFFEAHKKMAQLWLIKEESNKAIRILDDVISKKPDDYEAFCLRGEANVLARKIDKALMDFDISLKINPDSLNTYKGIITAYKANDNYDQIIKYSNEAIKIAPNDCFLLISRGEVYYQIKSIDDALSDFNKVLKIEPNNVEGLFYRGTILFEKENYDKSLTDINRLLKISPADNNTIFLRSKIFLAKKDYQTALFDIDRLIKKIEDLDEEDCTLEQYLLQAEIRYKSGWYETNPGSIMEDYLKLWNLESDVNDDYKVKSAKELELLKNIMHDRYKKAVVNYNQNKKIFFVYESNRARRTKEDLCFHSTVIKPKTYLRDPKLLFIDSFADDYCILLRMCTSKNDDYLKYYSHENIDPKIEPKYWFIVHAYTGDVYLRNWTNKNATSKKRVALCSRWKWVSIHTCEEEGGEYKYNSLEDAIDDYEKIIMDEHLFNTYINDYGKTGYKTFGWEIPGDERCNGNNFMDIFLVGST